MATKTKIVLPKVASHADDVAMLADRVDKVLSQLTSDLTNFQAPDAGLLGGETAEVVVDTYVTRDLFFQTFETDISTTWDLTTGVAGDLSRPLNGKAGGAALSASTEIHVAFPSNIAYDAARRYRIRCRYRRRDSNPVSLNVGVVGYAADGSTVVDRSGTAVLANGNNVCLAASGATPTTDAWVEAVGYFQGEAASGTGATPSTAPESPRVLHNNTRYFRPFVHFNTSGGSTQIEVDFIAIEVLPDRSEIDDLLEQVDGITKGSVSTTINNGGGVANNQVSSGALQSSSVTTAKVAAGAITAAEIAANTITAAQIAAATITANEIAAATITATEIAANTITAAEIAAASITSAELSVITLSSITATLGTVYAGIISNKAISPDAGIRLDASSSLPGTWLNYLDLGATGAAPFLVHDSGLTLYADGTADWPGAIVNTPQLTFVNASYNDTGSNVEYVCDWDYNSLANTTDHRISVECYENGVKVHTATGIAINATRPYTVTDTGAGDGVSDSHYAVISLYEVVGNNIVSQMQTREDISTV